MQGPRLYRFFNYEQLAYMPAPVGGWNPDANPWELADTQAPVLDNALIRPGRVCPRGALTNWADLSAITTPAPPLNVCGVQPVPGGSKLAIGRKAISSTAFVDPWFASIVRPTAAAALAAPTADLAIVFSGTAVTNTATAANLIPGPRGINFEGTRYYVSYGTATAPVLDAGGTFYGQATALCTLSSAGTPTALTNAPRGFIDIKGYQSRIWGLGGIDDPGAGTTFSPLALFFTNPIGSGGGNAASFADWKDPVAGTTNKIVMDGDTTDPGVGLATVRNGLLIFRYASVWLLKGTTTANYTLVPVSRDTGCIDPRSIVETDEGVYYMSRKGLMVTNGVTVKNVSGNVLHTLQSALEIVTAAIKSSFGGYVTCAVASGGQVVVSIGTESVTSSAPDGHIQPVWCGMFDPTYNAWTRITSALFANDANIITTGNNYPGWIFNTPDRRLLSIGDKYVTQWESYSASNTATLSTNANHAGTASQTSTGNTPWSNPSNATGPADLIYASATNASTAITENLQVTNFGFSVPTFATIVGVSVSVTGKASLTVSLQALSLMKAGAAVGTPKSGGGLWSSSEQPQPGGAIWGGVSDLWGTTLTPADINSSGFGVSVAAQLVSAGATAFVDDVNVTVFYTIASITQQQSFVKIPALYDTDASGAFQPIPFVWKTKLLPAVGVSSTARKKSQLKRYVTDYVFQGIGLPSTKGFTITLQDATGNQINDSNATKVLAATTSSMSNSSISGGQPNATTTIQRDNQDCWPEVIDVCAIVSWLDAQQATSPSFIAAEIYGVGIEFQHTSELR